MVLFQLYNVAATIENTEILIIFNCYQVLEYIFGLIYKRKYKKLFLIINVLAGCKCLISIIHTSVILAISIIFFNFMAFAPSNSDRLKLKS